MDLVKPQRSSVRTAADALANIRNQGPPEFEKGMLTTMAR
jgi:hypothetical protein